LNVSLPELDMDVVRSLTRSRQIGYHCAEAELWLAASDGGVNTTPLSYAAFEMRLEIERIAVELLVRLRGDRLLPEDLDSIGTFRRIEDRIYELAGHQRLIDRKVAFINLMLAALQGEQRVQRIHIGELKGAWHDCSRLCHVEWSLIADSPMRDQVAKEAFGNISRIQRQVRAIIDAGITWFKVADASFGDLQDRYVNGEVGDEYVRAWISERGLWSTLTKPDGTKQFVGVPIPPSHAG
jgi:hypothetical protein